MTSALHIQYALAATLTDPATGLSGKKGAAATRVFMPLALVHYEVEFYFDGAGGSATLDLANGDAWDVIIGVKSAGTINFTGLPVAAQIITVNALVYTFAAAAADGTEITIGADATETAANAVAAISARDTALDAINVLGVVTVSAAFTGVYGNAITLAEAATNVTVSGATLTGGVDAVTLTGGGVDYLGAMLPTMTKVHALLITCSSGSADLVLSTVLKDSITPDGGFQGWSRPGRADLIGELVITSGAAGTRVKVIVAASA